MTRPVTVTYVEMTAPPRPAPPVDPGSAGPDSSAAHRVGPVEVRRALHPNPELNRWLYLTVGRDYRWTDRAEWTDDQWTDATTSPGLATWLGYHDGSPVGYAELDTATVPDVEIVYFGLLPTFVGRGLGRPFLDAVVDVAWATDGAERVWLHTCTDDHPRALPNYLAAGFGVFDRRQE